MRRLLLLLSLLAVGCESALEPKSTLVLATTTSTRDSGLLDELVPVFEKQSGIEVKIVAVGSGQALEMGRRGDADVLLTHAPEKEEEFIAEGFGIERRSVMYNDFVIVGPGDDPEDLSAADSVIDAFARIANGASLFVSRGDNSGTHMKEERLWSEAEVDLDQEWRLESGSGMAATLRMASEKQAHTLTDRSTFLAQQRTLDLKILFEGDPKLQNNYYVMLVNPTKHPDVNTDAARKFAGFLLDAKTQKMISRCGVDEYDQPLFFVRDRTSGD